MGMKGDRQTAAGAAFVEGLMPRLSPLREVASRKMFGGHGLFQDGKMFGLVTSKAELFLKADESNMARFTRARSPRHGKMPYFRVPKRVLADDATLLDWARSAVKVAQG